jgi:hypothetical protein
MVWNPSSKGNTEVARVPQEPDTQNWLCEQSRAFVRGFFLFF